MSEGLAIGGVVLCGGESMRMGMPKASLPFGDELMLPRVVRLLSRVVEPIVVVAAAKQDLPDLPTGVLVVHDEATHRGPLEGLRVGLAAIADRVDAAYATSCDAPLLDASFVQQMASELGEYDAAVPVDGDFYQPLAAVYRTHIVKQIETLLASDNLRTSNLFNVLQTNRVSTNELRRVDPELRTLMNTNDPPGYLAALRLAGVTVDESLLKTLGL